MILHNDGLSIYAIRNILGKRNKLSYATKKAFKEFASYQKIRIGMKLFNIEYTNEELFIILFYGGMAAMTLRAKETEEYLTGKTWSRKNIEQAMKIIDEDFVPISDARSSAEGRKVMARNLLMKFRRRKAIDRSRKEGISNQSESR